MKQIRRNVFETNSSSTHSLTICTKDKFEAWQQGKAFYNGYLEEFIEDFELTAEQKEAAKKQYKNTLEKKPFYKNWESLSNEEKEVWYQSYYLEEISRENEDIISYEDYFKDSDLNVYVKEFKSPLSGDEMVAFGRYGYC